jgi:hypothetical protein
LLDARSTEDYRKLGQTVPPVHIGLERSGTNAQDTTRIEPVDSPATGAPTPHDEIAAAGFGMAPPPPVPHAPEVAQAMPSPPINLNAPNHDYLDSTGLPWDARIHASTHTKTAEGKWTARRGRDQAQAAIIEAELRAQVAGAATTPSAQPTYSQYVASGMPPEMLAPPAGIFGNSPSVQAVAPAGEPPPMTYQQLAPRILADMAATKVTNEMLQTACVAVGIPAFPALLERPDLIGPFYNKLYGVS